eukprot:scaffold11168_cov69-Phaeocystis_antarctica.AAC.3
MAGAGDLATSSKPVMVGDLYIRATQCDERIAVGACGLQCDRGYRTNHVSWRLPGDHGGERGCQVTERIRPRVRPA